jgi:hypothetical protein
MTPLRARLHRIEVMDVAALLGGTLNGILRVADGGDLDDATRQTEWWESALGGPVDELAARIDGLRASAGYRSALLPFAAGQQWRAAALRYLHLAIMDGSERRYRRWRWSARAYLGAVDRFVGEQALGARAAVARRELEAEEGGGARLRRSRIHASHFAALRERFTAQGERSGAEQQHAAERARDVLSDVARREQDRTALLRERDALRDAAAAAGLLGDPVAGRISLVEEVRAYERTLRSGEFSAAEVSAAAAGKALTTRLHAAFAAQPSDVFAGYEGEPPLLARLASTLERTQPLAVPCVATDDAE